MQQGNVTEALQIADTVMLTSGPWRGDGPGF